METKRVQLDLSEQEHAEMERLMAFAGLKTKREAVELGLRTLIRLKEQEAIRAYRGKLPWEGDLDAMRSSS